MRKVYNLIILLLLLVSTGLNAKNNPNKLTHNTQEAYAINEGMYIEVSNQYGEIEILQWDKDSIKFVVEIIVRSERNIDLNDVLDRIDVNFRVNSSYILAETSWADDANIFQKRLQNLKQGFGGSSNIEVNYKIYMPIDLELEIDNKFGSVFMGDYDGPLTISIEHGDLRARKLSNVKKISVKYGKLKITEMDNGNLELMAVNSANIFTANDIMITSSSSEIEIDDLNILNITSKHDDIRIENINKIYGNISLSDLRVTLITKESRLNAKFGSIYFKEIESSADKINIEGNKTDIFLNFNESFDGTFNIQVDEDKKLSMNYAMKVEHKKMLSETKWEIKAIHGSGVGTSVNIISQKGFIQIGK